MKKHLLYFLVLIYCNLYAQNYSRAKIYIDSNGIEKLTQLGIAADHGTHKSGSFIISDFSHHELVIAKENGFQVDILIEDVQSFYMNQNKESHSIEKATSCQTNSPNKFDPLTPTNFQLGTMGGYYTYEEFIAEIDKMHDLYPTLISLKSPISTFQSIEGRPIYWLKISDNPNIDEEEPEVLYTALHHAREPNSLSELIYFMWYVLENYSNSEEIQYLLNSTELYFVPMINPDGYVYNQTTNPLGGGMWRKNRRDNGDGTYGVDLNRNYSYKWNTTSSSTDPESEIYSGTHAFSEPETQAIKWFCENRKFKFAFNAHTYSNLILFPFGSTKEELTDDHDYFKLFTTEMVKFNHYQNKKFSSLYPASGISDDYMYYMDTVIKPKIYALTPEITSNREGFWLPSWEITEACKEMIWPNLLLAHLSHRYLIVEDKNEFAINTLSGEFIHSASRIGIENGPVTVSITPIKGIASIGNPIIHDLFREENVTANISYTLSPSLVLGEEIVYVLNTEYDGWTKHDTIIKTFGSLPHHLTQQLNSFLNWKGDFSLTNSNYFSSPTCFTDTPISDYSNNSNKTFTFNQQINLSNAIDPEISFYTKWSLESNYDFVQFQVSIDNGLNWIPQCGNYTRIATSSNGGQPVGEPIYDGHQLTWVKETIKLHDYIGQTITIRFKLISDELLNYDGYFFDDLELKYNLTDAKDVIYIYPNPSINTFTILLNKNVCNALIKIFDQNGKLVYQSSYFENINSETISLSNFDTGIYTVQVQGDNYFTTEKLIVMK